MTSELGESDADVAMRLRIGAVDRERFFEMRYCLVEAPLFQQNRSQIVLGVRIVGADCQHLVVMYPRLVKPSDCLQGTRQIVVRLDVIWLNAQRLANEIDAFIGLPILDLADAQEM